MTFNQLEYFVAVAETLNFTRAAEKFYISQTAITQQIKSLEYQIGVKLFIRTKRHVELTPAGIIYLNEAKLMIDRSKKAKEKALLASEGFSGSLNIGFMKGCEQIGLSDLITRFKEIYPDITLNFQSSNFSALLQSLYDYSNDVIFNLRPQTTQNDDIVFKSFKAIPLYVLIHLQHHFAYKSEILRQELQDETFIIIKTAKTEIINGFLSAGFLPKTIHYAEDIESLLLMVSANMGIAILPEYSMHYLNGLNSIRSISLVNDMEIVEIALAYNSKNYNPAIERFVNLKLPGQ